MDKFKQEDVDALIAAAKAVISTAKPSNEIYAGDNVLISLSKAIKAIEPEPRKGDAWLNILVDEDGGIITHSYKSKPINDYHLNSLKLIARIRVPYVEGRFDD